MASSTAPQLGEDYGLSRRAPAPPSTTGVRPWNVVHACPEVRDILPLLDVQVSAGMKPFLVTPLGSGTPDLYLRRTEENAKPTSLLSAWNDVRQWRRSLLEADPDQTAEIVHAHSFAAGMAGGRKFCAAGFDMNGCGEEKGTPARAWGGHPRVARSFPGGAPIIL